MQAKLIRSLVFVLLLGALLLGSVPLIRGLTGRPLIHDPQGFQNCRMASMAGPTNIVFWDNLVRPDRLVHANLYHLFLGAFANSCDLAVIAQVLLGILLSVGFWLLMQQLGVGQELALVATLILQLSPTYVYVFTNPFSAGFGITGMVFGALFLTMKCRGVKGWIYRGLTVLCFIISMGSGPWYLFASLIILWGETIVNKMRPYLAIVATLIAGFVFYYLDYAGVLVPGLVPFSTILNNLVFELGSAGGLSTSCIILGITGVLVSWVKLPRLITCYVLLFATFVGVFFFKDAGFILLVILPGFAAFIVLRIFEHKWVSQTLKYVTLGLAFFCLAFSGVMACIHDVSVGPTQSEFDAFKFLKELPSHQTVLSSPEYGAAIQAIAGKPVMLDSISDIKPSLNETRTILYTRNLIRAKTLLDKYSVGYIMITPAMKTGGIWDESDQGLLFLLRNNETFKKLESVNGIEVWQVLR